MLSVETIAEYQTRLINAMEEVIEEINTLDNVTEKDGVALYVGLVCALLIDDSMTSHEKLHRYRLMLETIAVWMRDDLGPNIAPEWESDNDHE